MSQYNGRSCALFRVFSLCKRTISTVAIFQMSFTGNIHQTCRLEYVQINSMRACIATDSVTMLSPLQFIIDRCNFYLANDAHIPCCDMSTLVLVLHRKTQSWRLIGLLCSMRMLTTVCATVGDFHIAQMIGAFTIVFESVGDCIWARGRITCEPDWVWQHN